MKKIPLFIIACLLVSVTTWAGWTIATPRLIAPASKYSPTVSCSADGKIIYLAVNDTLMDSSGFGNIRLYRSTDGGETWSQQIWKEYK
jgi:hypothetical protein